MKWALLLLLLFLLPACDRGGDCAEMAETPITFQQARVKSLSTDLQVSQFNSCQEMMDYTIKTYQTRPVYNYYGSDPNICQPAFSNTQGNDMAGALPENTNQPTNTQEKGVDESDRVKISQRYIFYARENSIAVMDRKTKEFVHSIESPGYWRPYIYVASEHLIVIRPHETPVIHDPVTEATIHASTQPVVYRNPEKFEVVFYNLRRDFRETFKKTILGHYRDSRLTRDGVLTLTTETYLMPESNISTNKKRLQTLTQNIDCGQISRPVVENYDFTLTSVHAFNTRDLSEQGYKASHLMGRFPQIYMNKNLYLSKENSWIQDSWGFGQMGPAFTIRMDLENKQWVEKARVSYEGNVPSQWSFKELGDYLYIATDRNDEPGGFTTHFNVYKNETNAMTLKKVITGIAPGETLRAARFTEEYAYLVTFRTVDPLFVIDLKDRDDPRIVSELKIPGFSSYLHTTYDDKLIGVGYSGDMRNLQLSLFDVADPVRPFAIEQRLVGEQYSSSNAQHDHHSFFYEAAWDTVAIPIQGYSSSNNWQDIKEYTGAEFFSIDDQGFTPLTRLSHGDWQEEHCPVYVDPNGWVIHPGRKDIARVHNIDGSLMTFSDFGARVHNSDRPSQELQRTLFNKPQEACALPYGYCTLIE